MNTEAAFPVPPETEGCPDSCTISNGCLKTPIGTFSLESIRGVSVRITSKPPIAVKILVALIAIVILQEPMAPGHLGMLIFNCIVLTAIGFWWFTHHNHLVILHTPTGDLIVADFEGSETITLGQPSASSHAARLCREVQKHIQPSA